MLLANRLDSLDVLRRLWKNKSFIEHLVLYGSQSTSFEGKYEAMSKLNLWWYIIASKLQQLFKLNASKPCEPQKLIIISMNIFKLI